MPKGRISEPRNKNLLKMINLIGIGEHAGSGVPDIYDVWESEGLDTPVILEQFGADQPDRTTMILPLVTTNISESDRKKQSEKTIGKSSGISKFDHRFFKN